jgi:hypothetical protein
VEDAEKARELATLLETVDDGHFDDLTYRHNFAEQLLGVEPDHSQDGNKSKYLSVSVTGTETRPFGKDVLLAPITIAFISR